jgi:hypothetical protein
MIKRVLSIQKRERGTAPYTVRVRVRVLSTKLTQRGTQDPTVSPRPRLGACWPICASGKSGSPPSRRHHPPFTNRRDTYPKASPPLPRNLEDAARLMAQALERKREVLGNGHITVGMLEYEMSGVAQEMAKFNTGTRTHQPRKHLTLHIDTTHDTHDTRHAHRISVSYQLLEASSEYLRPCPCRQVRSSSSVCFVEPA